MDQLKEPLKWVFAGLLIGLLAFVVLSLPNLAQAAQPAPESPLEQIGMYQAQMSSTHYSLDWDVIGSGGGETSSSHFMVEATIGQPTVGQKSSSHYSTCTGFWCGIDLIYQLFLPHILEEA